MDEWHHFSTTEDDVLKAFGHCREEREGKAHNVGTCTEMEASLYDSPLRKAQKPLLYKKCTG